MNTSTVVVARYWRLSGHRIGLVRTVLRVTNSMGLYNKYNERVVGWGVPNANDGACRAGLSQAQTKVVTS